MQGLNTEIRVEQPYFVGAVLRLDGPISLGARWALSGPPVMLEHLGGYQAVIDAAGADVPAPGPSRGLKAWPTWATLEEAEAEIPRMLRGARVLALPYDRLLDRARTAGDLDAPTLGVYGSICGSRADLYYGDHRPVTALPYIGRAPRVLSVDVDHLGETLPMIGRHGTVFIYCEDENERADMWAEVYGQGAVYISSRPGPNGGFMLAAMISHSRAALKLGQVWGGLVTHHRYFERH